MSSNLGILALVIAAYTVGYIWGRSRVVPTPDEPKLEGLDGDFDITGVHVTSINRSACGETCIEYVLQGVTETTYINCSADAHRKLMARWTEARKKRGVTYP